MSKTSVFEGLWKDRKHEKKLLSKFFFEMKIPHILLRMKYEYLVMNYLAML